MAKIKGITVTLFERVKTGEDNFHRAIYEEVPVEVPNVLVAPASSDDITDQLNLTGKRAVYTLAIPKGDTHEWADRKVRFFGQTWRVLTLPVMGIPENIPLDWNAKVMVERYEQ